MASANALTTSSILQFPTQGSLSNRTNQRQKLNCRPFTSRKATRVVGCHPLIRVSTCHHNDSHFLRVVECYIWCKSVSIKKGIDKTITGSSGELEKKSRSIEGRDGVKASLPLSLAGNGEDIGIMIADAIDKVRADGVLSIESSSSFETTVDVEEGMEIDRGRKALLQDIAILTELSSKPIDPGLMIENTEVEQLGIARKGVVRDAFTCMILRSRRENCQVVGGVAVIKVGVCSETELEDRKLGLRMQRMQLFFAIEEGIVHGGGAALVHLSMFVPAIKEKFDDL
ncbi:hypothetical protein IFM89_005650 [Coptis chinensis]|uniref:Uncharacterized protein n=1 Tax=Coptis chinensis TaxID=261450 RepID=A0A835IX65_9MAGN|nr:hypothetical protein IFM89_005650 [Coptis chinensis]